ncbi:MAG: Mut7-C RNAse domain-containing protein [Dehalococcoidia bacterium]|nr:Mut7-C RNAse domain-containing protein [Dehalococcoidia bacterium]
MDIRFLADNNVGKLARWLRIMGYDVVLFRQEDDGLMIRTALAEDRVILTKDAELVKRRIVSNGTLRVALVKECDPERQVQEVVRTLNLDYQFRPFSRCLECNQALIPRDKEQVRELVPVHVLETQTRYTQCPACHRVYWRGTHWQAMVRGLAALQAGHDNSSTG